MTENDYKKKIIILKNKSFRKMVYDEIFDKSKNKLFVGDWKKSNLLKQL